jgi:hypothetical protein
MNILYYSNYCKHSKAILDYLVKNDLIESLNCICIDQRKVDQQQGQIHIMLENGNTVLLPPNVYSVPSLLLVKENYKCVVGNEIKNVYKAKVLENNDLAFQGNGEPLSFSLGSKDIQSEQFTFYNSTTEDLSAKGSGGMRPLYHYVPADGNMSIPTPPDTYKSNKVGNDVTVDTLQQKRSDEMNKNMVGINQTPFLPT